MKDRFQLRTLHAYECSSLIYHDPATPQCNFLILNQKSATIQEILRCCGVQTDPNAINAGAVFNESVVARLCGSSADQNAAFEAIETLLRYLDQRHFIIADDRLSQRLRSSLSGGTRFCGQP